MSDGSATAANAAAPAAAAAATATAAAPAAAGVVELSVMYPKQSMEESLSDLASYARAHATAPVSVPRLPPVQRLDDPNSPPVWPDWADLGGPCSFPTSLGSAPPDSYGSGAMLHHFESHVSNLLGKDSALFCVTGTMAQLIALRLHAHGRNKIFACHPKSHLLLHENNAFDLVDGLSALSIGSPTRPLSLAEIETSFGKHWKQPSCLLLELPDRELGGQTIAWDELVAIRAWALRKGVRMHLDGARLWEIQSHYRRSFQEIAAQFDSVYVSFYKGIQGPTGAMLLGDDGFVKEACVWQHRMGGRLWQVWPMVLGAQRALNANLGTFVARGDKMREVVAAIMEAQRQFVRAREQQEPGGIVQRASRVPTQQSEADAASAAAASVAASSSAAAAAAAVAPSAPAPSPSLAADSSPFFHFVPATPTCSMVHMYLHMTGAEAESLCAAVRTREGLGLLLRIRAAGKTQCVWEWNMGTENARVDTKVFVRAWKAFMQLRYEQLREQAMQ